MTKKPITNEYIGESGVKYIFEYYESDSFNNLPQNRIKQCYAVAFLKNKIIIVDNSQKGTYGLIGGSVEEDEHPNDTLIREIKEEGNLKVLNYKPIGYQKVIDTGGIQEPFYQLRYFAIVEPYGPFESDPAGKVTKVIECNPKDYKKYFDWGEIGERIMERALEMLREYSKKTD